jgi:hypothetical protein
MEEVMSAEDVGGGTHVLQLVGEAELVRAVAPHQQGLHCRHSQH